MPTHNHTIAYSFQPTLPVRGATLAEALEGEYQFISTHAPRAGSDMLRSVSSAFAYIISTHAPRAGSDSSRAPMVAPLF